MKTNSPISKITIRRVVNGYIASASWDYDRQFIEMVFDSYHTTIDDLFNEMEGQVGWETAKEEK